MTPSVAGSQGRSEVEPGATSEGVSDPTPAIRTQGLTKTYGAFTAVDCLSITVSQGEIFGFLGPNGAGKTTTMRMLLGLVRPTRGTAWILGLNIRRHLGDILAQTGSVIENPTFYPFLSGRDNLRVVARLTSCPDRRIEEILDLVELAADAKRKFKHYSLGMKQRLAVGAALLDDPRLLILDEPANGLDPAGIVEMRTLMKRLKDEGKAVFVSSHVLHEIEQVCDRIAILNQGQVVVQGRVESLLEQGSHTQVCVADPERANAILTDVPWIEAVTRRDGALIVTAQGGRSAEINRVLTEQGVYASEIRPQAASLEQYFLEVTRGAENS